MSKKEYLKQYYKENKEEIIKQQKEYRKRSKEQYNLYYRNKVINNPEKYLLQQCKDRAKKIKKDFNLELSDINIPKYCPYLDIELGPYKGDATFSVDRIDNNIGYVKGNIEVISTLANRMKHTASVEQLIIFAQSILRRYS